MKAALGEEDALDLIARMENWEINRFTISYKRLCGGIYREDWTLSHFSGKPEASTFLERTPVQDPQDLDCVRELLEIIRRHKPTRFFAEGVGGKGYIYDRKFSLTSPIAVEKDLATAKAQVEKFNAEEE